MSQNATKCVLPASTPASEYRKVLEVGRRRRAEAFLQIQQIAAEEEEKFRQQLELLGHEHGHEFRCPGVVVRRWEREC